MVCTNELEGEEMDLQNIQEQLNTEFVKDETRIIFWFDDKGDYSAEMGYRQIRIQQVPNENIGTYWMRIQMR